MGRHAEHRAIGMPEDHMAAAWLADHEAVGFRQMSDLVAECLARVAYLAAPLLADLVATDAETRRIAASLL